MQTVKLPISIANPVKTEINNVPFSVKLGYIDLSADSAASNWLIYNACARIRVKCYQNFENASSKYEICKRAKNHNHPNIRFTRELKIIIEISIQNHSYIQINKRINKINHVNQIGNAN